MQNINRIPLKHCPAFMKNDYTFKQYLGRIQIDFFNYGKLYKASRTNERMFNLCKPSVLESYRKRDRYRQKLLYISYLDLLIYADIPISLGIKRLKYALDNKIVKYGKRYYDLMIHYNLWKTYKNDKKIQELKHIFVGRKAFVELFINKDNFPKELQIPIKKYISFKPIHKILFLRLNQPWVTQDVVDYKEELFKIYKREGIEYGPEVPSEKFDPVKIKLLQS